MDIMIYDNFSTQIRRHVYATSPICTAEIVEPFYIILPDAMRPESTPDGVTIFPDGIPAPVPLGETLGASLDGMPVMEWKDHSGHQCQYYPGTFSV